MKPPIAVIVSLIPVLLLATIRWVSDQFLIEVLQLKARYPLTISGTVHEFRTQASFAFLFVGLLVSLILRMKRKEEAHGWLTAIASGYMICLLLSGISVACVSNFNFHVQ